MKIGLVRHFPVKHAFLKGLVSQQDVLSWFTSYNQAGVMHLPGKLAGDWQICYSSEMPRTRETARILFQKEPFVSGLLNEPMPDAVFTRNLKLPFLVWAMVVRWAIMRNHASQSHRKEVLESRIQQFFEELLARPETEVLVVSHAFTMEILSRILLKNGFSGKKLNRPAYGELHVFERR